MTKNVYYILGVLLIVCSVFLFSYSGIQYTTDEKVAEVGPVTISTEEDKFIPFSPIAGGLALIVGIGLIMVGRNK